MATDVKNQFPQSAVWRSAFKSYEEMEKGDFEFLINRFLPHGITFFAGLAGVGKTWLGLSAAKALVTGQSFLKSFSVPHPCPVIYLIPESGERSFRIRLEAMRLTVDEDRFLCRTMGNGPTLALDSLEVVSAVRALQPVVILDTAIRFSRADDENSAAQNRELATGMFDLLSGGAQGIIALHHSPKNARSGEVTLENTLRGTGDLGALADAVYNLRREDQQTLTVAVQCVKARDFEPLPPFHIQGRPYINQIGDFAMIEEPSDEEKLLRALGQDPSATVRQLATMIGVGINRISTLAEEVGWKKEGKIWIQDKKRVA